MQPYKQATSTPVPKIAAVGIAGVVLTVLTAGASLLGIQLPSSVTDNVGALVTGVVALVSIVHFVAGYFTHDTQPSTTPLTVAGPPTAPSVPLPGPDQVA